MKHEIDDITNQTGDDRVLNCVIYDVLVERELQKYVGKVCIYHETQTRSITVVYCGLFSLYICNIAMLPVSPYNTAMYTNHIVTGHVNVLKNNCVMCW